VVETTPEEGTDDDTPTQVGPSEPGRLRLQLADSGGCSLDMNQADTLYVPDTDTLHIFYPSEHRIVAMEVVRVSEIEILVMGCDGLNVHNDAEPEVWLELSTRPSSDDLLSCLPLKWLNLTAFGCDSSTNDFVTIQTEVTVADQRATGSVGFFVEGVGERLGDSLLMHATFIASLR